MPKSFALVKATLKRRLEQEKSVSPIPASSSPFLVRQASALTYVPAAEAGVLPSARREEAKHDAEDQDGTVGAVASPALLSANAVQPHKN